MRILVVSQIVPWPPDSGPRIKTGHVLRYLAARGHQVTVAAFTRPEEEGHLPALARVCAGVHPLPLRRGYRRDLAAWLRSHRSGRPFLVERDDEPAMRALVARLVASDRFDAVHADQLPMAQFVAGDAGALPSVFDAHNATWRLATQLGRTGPRVLRPALMIEAQRLRRYEGETVRRFHRTLAVTAADRDALQAAAQEPGPDRITVVPIGVDTVTLLPVARPPGSAEILTLGTLHYPPNLDGIRWLARAVLPRVRRTLPAASLTIVGPRPARDLRALARRQPDAVRVTGYVPDVAPHVARAAVVAVPVRVAAGMRVRILEAFARAAPVVTTTIGLEGIEAEPGRDVLIGDTAEAFADALLRVLRDPTLAAQLGARGRRLVEARYDWRRALAPLECVYPSAGACPPCP